VSAALSVDQTLRKAKSLARKGASGEAETLLRSLLERFPDNKRAIETLQSIAGPQVSKRRTPEQMKADTQALAMLYKQGRHKDVVEQGPVLVAQYPRNAVLHNIVGASLTALEQFAAAANSFREAARLEPESAEHWNNLGQALNALGRVDEAATSLKKAVALKPNFANALSNLGYALTQANRSEEALAFLERAVAIKPDHPEALNNLAIARYDLGQKDEALANYEKALAARPHYADCWRNYAALKRFTKDDPAIAKLERVLAAATGAEDRMPLSLALAKAYDDVGETDKAFEQFARGNMLARQRFADPMREHREMFATLRSIFEEGVPEPVTMPVAKKRPIFVVGMPRSGTSLVEQILASHRDVHGAGEMQAMRVAMAPAAAERRTDQHALEAVRQRYLDAIDALGVEEPVIVDKMPQNFRWIGYMATALPEATIIHTRRDPVAVGWSIYRTFFPATGLEFTFDLADIAEYYRLYEDLMAFWAERLPGRIVDLDYEALTENQEEETRKLLEQCGLPFDEACLSPHKTKRAVRTASAAQVREKIYTGSSEAWRKYEKHLGPLIEALGRAA